MKKRLCKLMSMAAIGLAMLGAAGCALTPIEPTAELQAEIPVWTLVWSDEFSGDALDRTKWAPETACWGGGNDERQCYTDRPENIRVADGVLRLIARPERWTGPLLARGMAGAPGGMRTQDYTSGKVKSQGLAAWRYGRFSARMKLPAGLGTWPAFWMMPEKSVYGRWPLSGEIDIMEAVNLGAPCEDCALATETRTSGAAHFGDLAPDNAYLYQKAPESASPGPAEDWRVYAVEWAEGTIQWLVDGQVFLRLDAGDWYTASPRARGREAAPFDQPFHLILNLAVGGRLAERSPGGGFDPESFPAELQVDWVRVEQCAGDTQTGRACLTRQEWTGAKLGPWERTAD